MKYASIDFHVNYFTEDPDEAPKFYVFGFTVEDPTGSVALAMQSEDVYVEFGEDLEEHLEGVAVDSGFDADEQFFGAGVYELGEEKIDLIRSGVQKLRDWFVSLGGIVGPTEEIVGGEEITDHVELLSKLSSNER